MRGQAVLIDADTGQVLYGKNEHSRMEPASLTKIMTCLLAMEHSDPQEPVTATAESLNLPLDASVLGLYEGETMTMEQMLYAMMLPSANDAANAVGVHIAGSLSAFAQMMNEKAQELGLQDSTFYNSNGLPEEGHLSSAYDLVQITRRRWPIRNFWTMRRGGLQHPGRGAERGPCLFAHRPISAAGHRLL